MKRKHWDGGDYCERFQTLQTNRRQWESLWEEVARYTYPRRQGFTDDDMAGYITPGEDKMSRSRIYDSSAIYSNEMLASGIHGMLTNPAQEWWRATVRGVTEPDGDTQRWLQQVQRTLYGFQTNPYGGFSTAKHEVYLEFTAFGTGVQYTRELSPGKVLYQGIPLAQCFIDEGHDGNIDTIYRRFNITVRVAVQMFGYKNLSKKIQTQYDKDLFDERVAMLHCVQPNLLYHPKRKDMFPISSVYVDRTEREIVRESGYNENPFQVPRFFKASGEVYGRSPAMTALPDIKMLNEMQKTIIKAGQKAVDPPWLVPDDGMFSPVRAFSGGMSYYRAGGDKPEPMLLGQNIPLGLDMIQALQQRIGQMFYLDQLQFGERPQMTATEVIQRTEDRLRLLGPVNGRLQQELLGPEIDRLFGIAMRNNMLPPPPQQVQGRDFDVDYVSPLSLAPKQLKAQALTRVFEIASPLIEMNPQVFDKINSDEALEYLGEMYNLDRRIFNDDELVTQIRQNRAKQEQAAAEAENMKQQSVAANNMAGAVGEMSNVEAITQ